jgi:hypothetical protein
MLSISTQLFPVKEKWDALVTNFGTIWENFAYTVSFFDILNTTIDAICSNTSSSLTSVTSLFRLNQLTDVIPQRNQLLQKVMTVINFMTFEQSDLTTIPSWLWSHYGQMSQEISTPVTILHNLL